MSEDTTPSLRDALEAAVPAAESAAPTPSPAAGSTSQSAETIPTPSVQEAGARQSDGEQPLLVPAESKPSPQTGRTPGEPAADQEPAIQRGPRSGPRADRAPVAWKPQMREHWAALPKEVRVEITRREREVQDSLNGASEARKYADSMSRAIAPYDMLIQAEGGNHALAVSNVMATAARMRTAPAPQLAAEMARLIEHFGVGRFGPSFINTLDSALVGSVEKPDPNTQMLQQTMNQELAPIRNFMSQFQNAQLQQRQTIAQDAHKEVSDFLARAEFAADVREDMADLMEVAQRRGREMTLLQAYQQACLSHPQVRSVLEKRQQSVGGQQLTSTAQAAKNRAVSVTGAPAMGVPKTARLNIRNAIEAALAQHSRS